MRGRLACSIAVTIPLHRDLGFYLGRALLEVAAMEGAAAAIAHKLGNSALLTAQERDFAVERLQRDEVRHMNWFRGAAVMLGGSQARNLGVDLKARVRILERMTSSTDRCAVDRCLLARMNHDERYLLRRFERFRFVLAHFLPPDLMHSFSHIETDELVHAAWGRQVLRRLELAHPEWRADRRRCQTLRNSANTLVKLQTLFQVLGGPRPLVVNG